MTRSIRTAAAALALLLASAGGVLAKKQAEGRPTFKADGPEAFWIWHDRGGWHLRVSAPARSKHAYHGVIRGDGLGAIKVTRKSLAPNVTIADGILRFDLEVGAGGEGFDWQSSGPCTTYELKLDGKPRPDRIHVGATAESPAAMPFDACQM
jgi:hypothetical protein